MDNTCPRCGSTKVIPDQPLGVQVNTASGPGGGAADVIIQGAPKAWIFTDATYAGLTVRICGQCGHAELQAQNYRLLYEKYQKAQQA